MRGFEQDYIFSAQTNIFETQSIGLNMKKFQRVSRLYKLDPLHWCLTQLHLDRDNSLNFDPAMLFSFLDSWLEKANTKDQARLNSALLEDLSHLSAMTELLCAVRQFCPRLGLVSMAEGKSVNMDRVAWRTNKHAGLALYKQSAVNQDTMNRLFKDIRDIHFPKGKRDTKWLVQADQVRHNLNEFWEHAWFMHEMERHAAKEHTATDKAFTKSMMLFAKSSEHLRELTTERGDILSIATSTLTLTYQDPTHQSQQPDNGGPAQV